MLGSWHPVTFVVCFQMALRRLASGSPTTAARAEQRLEEGIPAAFDKHYAIIAAKLSEAMQKVSSMILLID